MTDAVQIELIKSIPACITAVGVLVGILLTWRNGKKTDGVHDSLNSRLTQWQKQVADMVAAAHAQGRQDERDSQNGE